MNIIDTFPYSEPHELDILLIKFHLEDAGVNKWIICENDYTFRNQYKGFTLISSLDTDSRFDKFRDKIIVIEKSYSSTVNDLSDDFKIGNKQRKFGQDYIDNNFDDDTWVIISDVDESFDFNDQRSANRIYDVLERDRDQSLYYFSRRRYWYDFNNYAFILYHFPIMSLSKARGNLLNHSHKKLYPYNLDTPVGFEYSFCFSLEHIIRKLDTYGHIGYTREDVELALKLNCWMLKSYKKERLRSPQYYIDNNSLQCWFETIELTDNNSPAYVRENLEWLKTNVVDKNYINNRKVEYPEYF